MKQVEATPGRYHCIFTDFLGPSSSLLRALHAYEEGISLHWLSGYMVTLGHEESMVTR